MAKATIEIDLYGAPLSQTMTDRIHSLAAHAQQEGQQLGDVIIRNVDMHGFPRLIVDYGELYETLCAVAKEYKEYRAKYEA